MAQSVQLSPTMTTTHNNTHSVDINSNTVIIVDSAQIAAILDTNSEHMARYQTETLIDALIDDIEIGAAFDLITH